MHGAICFQSNFFINIIIITYWSILGHLILPHALEILFVLFGVLANNLVIEYYQIIYQIYRCNWKIHRMWCLCCCTFRCDIWERSYGSKGFQRNMPTCSSCNSSGWLVSKRLSKNRGEKTQDTFWIQALLKSRMPVRRVVCFLEGFDSLLLRLTCCKQGQSQPTYILYCFFGHSTCILLLHVFC